MKKKIAISLSEDLIDYLEKNFINKSAYIEALIRNKSMMNATIEEDVDEVFDAKGKD